MTSKKILFDLLKIPSPTYQETKKAEYLKRWCKDHLSDFKCLETGNNMIFSKLGSGKETLAFIGHMDTVPAFFEPYEKNGMMYGAGASDMQAGIASFLSFIKANEAALLARYSIMIILYDKEEGTPIHENGLNELIQFDKNLIKQIDIAVVAEPTNNAIQLGCVGSLHMKVSIKGKAAHSARPWNGENALYKAIPIIKAISEIQPLKQTVFGVDFFDVIDFTESGASPGRTTVPDLWEGNINYRFSPKHSSSSAIEYVQDLINSLKIEGLTSHLVNIVNAGSVIEHKILKKAKEILTVEAKQAWTDVAQLTQLGICAFNFGPGLQSQAHLPNECVNLSDMLKYEKLLKKLFLEG
ncbi:MAG: M20/M25/M40 family metallo-hydrolase [Candidatus Margulisiibacteriota bacterium]